MSCNSQLTHQAVAPFQQFTHFFPIYRGAFHAEGDPALLTDIGSEVKARIFQENIDEFLFDLQRESELVLIEFKNRKRLAVDLKCGMTK